MSISPQKKFLEKFPVKYYTFGDGNMEGDSKRKDDDKIGEEELGDGPEDFASDENMASNPA